MVIVRKKIYWVVKEKNLSVLVLACIGVTGLSRIIAAEDCIYKDDYGEPIINVGGAGFATFVALLGGGGGLGIPDDYETWDLNADGILDKVQFELLTEILCMSNILDHPTVNFQEIRTTFEDNLALYWEIVDSLMNAEAALIAGAADLRQVGIEIGEAATAAGIYTDPLPPEVFDGGVLPDAWIGATWMDLRYALKDTGDSIIDLANQGLIGSPSSAIWMLLNNSAMAYIMAALWGLDSSFTVTMFESALFDTLNKLVTFEQLDWGYILGVLFAHGLTTTAAANAEASIGAIGFDDLVFPAPDALAITSNGEDALHADVLWGEETLWDIYANNGGNIDAMWEEILTQLPALPVGNPLIVYALSFLGIFFGMIVFKNKKAHK